MNRKTSASEKQVKVGRINFIDIIDHPQVNHWMKFLNSTEIKQFSRLFCDNNADRFYKLFGENIPVIPKNFNPEWGKLWQVYKNHITWLIFTGNEGTIFLVETSLTQEEFQQESSIGLGIIKFLEALKEKLCCNE